MRLIVPTPRTICLVAIALGAFGLAFGLVLDELAQPHGLYGVTQYDDGVYLTAALRLASGALPYRDFVFIQPPGIAILFAPLGLIAHSIGTREAMGVARILTALVVGANAALVVVALRHRRLVAAFGAGAAFALYPPAYTADHTLMLEPYLVLCCLVGILLAFSKNSLAGPGRLLGAGLVFGFAGAVKTWAIVPVLALLVVIAVSQRGGLRRGALGRFGLGVALGFCVPCAVFFFGAPHAFINDVITSQLGRTTVRPTPALARLWAISGLSYASGTFVPQANAAATELASGLLAGTIVLAGVVPSLFTRAARAWFVFLSAAGIVAILFIPPQFFDHYAYFSAAFLALALGEAIGNLADGAGRLVAGASSRVAHLGLAGVGVAACAVIVLGVHAVLPAQVAYEQSIMDRFGDPGPSFAAGIPKGACALSDVASILVTADRAISAKPDCPPVIDATGTWLSIDPTHPPVRSGTGVKNPAIVALWRHWFAQADYVAFSGAKAFRIPWTPALHAYFSAHFHRVTTTGLLVYARS